MVLPVDNDRAKELRLNPYQRDVLDRIPVGRDHWRFVTGKANATYIDFCAAGIKVMMPGHKLLIGKPIAKPVGDEVKAFINHNRWVAFCECGGQEVVDYGYPQFYCWHCHNWPNNGIPRPVDFPGKRKRKSITMALLVRPSPINRNWHYMDSVADLVGQNLRRGLPGRKE